MDYFYDGQIRRYIAQFINVFSNFAYKDAKGNLVQVPVRYGDISRQVAQILRKNSENSIPSAPFIACYIKDLQFDRPRLQDPTFISKINIRERDFDVNSNQYINNQGSNYTVERIMPSPYLLSMSADIWTTSLDQKLQLWEQIVVFFNPSFEIQTTDNYIDWTSLSVIHLENQTWSSRAIPQGVNEDIDIMTLNFTAPVWITPPAKVKKLGVVTKIISNVFAVGTQGTIKTAYNIEGAAEIFNEVDPDEEIIITPGNYDLLILNNVARIVTKTADESVDLTDPSISISWQKLLDVYPGKFRAGLSQLRFSQEGASEIIAYVSLDPTEERNLILNINTDTIPTNTVISGRGTIDAIVNPLTFAPSNPVAGTRYLILEGINDNPGFGTPGYQGPISWQNSNGSDFQANANDLIEYDGNNWNVVFNSQSFTGTVFVTNAYTGTQYKFFNNEWSKTYEGIYSNKLWRLIL